MSEQIELKDVMLSDEWFEARGGEVRALTEEWMKGYYGERCPDFEPGCECCERWKLFDLLFSEPGELP